MSDNSSTKNVNYYTLLRAKDWRYSVLPFVAGSLYLSMLLFGFSFNLDTLLFIVAFLISSVGFAATGYLINDFFDIRSDAKAGKENKLKNFSKPKIFFFFFLSFSVLFIPWIWLPVDSIIVTLIFLEIVLLLVYSLPFTRLKNVYWLSVIIDSLYAYVIPLILAVYTSGVFAEKPVNIEFLPLVLSMFVFGFRNIFIHQLRDINYDIKAGIVTLPQKFNIRETNNYLMTSVILEVLFFVSFCILTGIKQPAFFIWLFVYSVILLFKILKTKKNHTALSVDIKYSLSDVAYYLWFPLFNSILLIYTDWRWLIILPFHIALLIPRFRLEFIYFLFEKLWLKLKAGYHFIFLNCFSRPVNYMIYYSFKLFNVDLRKKNMSASAFIQTLLKK